MDDDYYLMAQYGLVVSHVVLATISSGHALLYKKDQRAALGWIGVCILFPIAGSLFYYTFGINRVRARAHDLARKKFFQFRVPHERGEHHTGRLDRPSTDIALEDAHRELANVSDAVTRDELVAGNRITTLTNGDVAFGDMLEAIDEACDSVLLMTYIFRTDTTGRRFIDALTRAADRGVACHVLIDGIGDWYSWPRASQAFRGSNVEVARFLPPRFLPPSFLVNLRNHRKLLVVDGAIAFSGGMNIADDHCEVNGESPRVQDMHFRFHGPVATDLTRHFAETWLFATRQELEIATAPAQEGDAICRIVVDGPDENMDKLEMLLMGAISVARWSIDIMTPYFLPTREMISALKAAKLRGVAVNIILPERSNLRYVDWATCNMLWELLQWQINVYYQPVPFAHTKLFVVDNDYSLVGSANQDPRSLRLNFELCVEIFDRSIAQQLLEHCRRTIDVSRQISLVDVDERSFPVRLRDAFFWLFSPYL